MGKSKNAKERKFDRNVEISAPILDPEIIKAIHTPPKGQRLDIKHGGFKALLSDLNSQDSTDELMPLNDNHVPSYIGISCAVSGYSNYASFSRKSAQSPAGATNPQSGDTVPSRSRATSPVLHRMEPQINHITIDKSNIQSADQERKELTEKLSASAHDRQRSPSPCIPPTEDDRHHGAYVGARYCPLPPPSKLVNKHIPLLGIDDDQNPDEVEVEENNKVEKRIASLYGGDFVEDWRESMTHKAKKELTTDQTQDAMQAAKSPKDLVTLKPTPPAPLKEDSIATGEIGEIDLSASNAKVLANVDKQFLNKLLSDDNHPMPVQQLTSKTPTQKSTEHISTAPQPAPANLLKLETDEQLTKEPAIELTEEHQTQLGKKEELEVEAANEAEFEQEPQESVLKTREVEAGSASEQSPPEHLLPPQELNLLGDDEEPMSILPEAQHGEQQHIEYEIRASSPVDNESSPVKLPMTKADKPDPILEVDESVEAELVNQVADVNLKQKDETATTECAADASDATAAASDTNGGLYYLELLEKEKSFIAEQVAKAESILAIEGSEMDEDTEGRVRSVIGKANLLTSKKFKQFRELCEANINRNEGDQFATLNEDLAGFWDMLEIQVVDVRKSFDTLWKVEKTNWNTCSAPSTDECPLQLKTSLSEKSSSAKPVKLNAQKDQERREKLRDHINQMKQNQAAANAIDKTNDVVEVDDSAETGQETEAH